uniref:Beta-amylase n=1 Tax=Oryza glumipatula TaxID=40148 RepID=A0A0D9YJN2_9ORYZ
MRERRRASVASGGRRRGSRPPRRVGRRPAAVQLGVVTAANELEDAAGLRARLRRMWWDAGVDGVMADVWWGIVEGTGPARYEWRAYREPSRCRAESATSATMTPTCATRAPVARRTRSTSPSALTTGLCSMAELPSSVWTRRRASPSPAPPARRRLARLPLHSAAPASIP